ncbi:30S ribosomal protein S7 [Candidatus Vidania fulgoroideorum]
MELKRMSRRKKNKTSRKIFNDLKYNNYYISKFINIFMISGKKSISEKIIYNVLSNLKKIYNINPLKIFKKSVINCSPKVELKKKKVGGTFYQIPVSISKKRSINKAIKFIRNNSLKRKNKNISDSLLKEIVDTYNDVSMSVKNRDEIHKKAELNRAFSHYSF